MPGCILCSDPSEKSEILFVQAKCNAKYREEKGYGASGLPNDNRDANDADDNKNVEKNISVYLNH